MKPLKSLGTMHKPSPTLLHEYFENQVTLRPDHIAIECGAEAWTYSELNQRATQLAGLLQAHGVGAVRWLVFAPPNRATRSRPFWALRAGAAYVPLDPKFPVKRMEAIIRDASISVVLCDSAIAPQLHAFGVVEQSIPSSIRGRKRFV